MASVGSGTTRSGSTSSCAPRPVQRGQAPCGELNEKTRGSSSASETPCSGHAKFSLKSIVSHPCRSTSIATSPAARPAAVSIDCASRWRRSGFIASRSTTTSIVCLRFLSRTISSSSSRCSPSTLTRVKPSARSSSSTSLNSPLRSRTTGALTVNFVPSGSCSTWSTIDSCDWPAIGRPQTGQCGRPTRAYSRRR